MQFVIYYLIGLVVALLLNFLVGFFMSLKDSKETSIARTVIVIFWPIGVLALLFYFVGEMTKEKD